MQTKVLCNFLYFFQTETTGKLSDVTAATNLFSAVYIVGMTNVALMNVFYSMW